MPDKDRAILRPSVRCTYSGKRQRRRRHRHISLPGRRVRAVPPQVVTVPARTRELSLEGRVFLEYLGENITEEML